jgi:hypothetical protein
VFLESKGDLPSVIRAIVDDPSFFDRRVFRAKFKRPWEFVVSALRATHAEAGRIVSGENYLEKMNEPLYRCADPTGYYDQAEAWCDPGAMAVRWAFASDLVSGRIGGLKVPSSLYRDLPADRPRAWKEILAARILPVAGIGARTSASIDAVVEAELKKGTKNLAPAIVAMLLGSPEFQKQ